MNIIKSIDKNELGRKAAELGAQKINEAIKIKGSANIIVATGSSQFEMLSELIKKEIEWHKVTGFHLDEYIGIIDSHPASFRKYLKDRFVDKVNPGEFFYINGERDPNSECNRLNNIISNHNIDVAFIGIGENAHIAFNDPPADFETEDPYIIVDLDEACRDQQLGEGWFDNLEDVPLKAISMSVKQILKSKTIICSVPDLRKADAVKKTVESNISPNVPASILKNHSDIHLFLDIESSSKLES